MPRSEPPNWASGGKVVKVDRVEWSVVPDATTKMAAIQAGEYDWWENPPADFWPVLAGDSNIALERLDPLGGMGCLRFNFLYPPFDNVKMRQAVLMAASQADFMTAFVGEEKNWNLCPSFFTCGTPMASDAGSEALSSPRDFEKAKKLIAEAGYKGETIVAARRGRPAADSCRGAGCQRHHGQARPQRRVCRRATGEPSSPAGR